MAKAEIQIDVDVKITDETASKCLQILEWYVNERPGVWIEGKRTPDGRTEFRIVRGAENGD